MAIVQVVLSADEEAVLTQVMRATGLRTRAETVRLALFELHRVKCPQQAAARAEGGGATAATSTPER